MSMPFGKDELNLLHINVLLPKATVIACIIEMCHPESQPPVGYIIGMLQKF